MPRKQSKLAEYTLRVAWEQAGQGEEGRNNDGFSVRRYKRGQRHLIRGSWCAHFLSWCLEEASHAMGSKESLVKRSRGARGLFKSALLAGGTRQTEPEVGALVLWSRGQTGWHGHVGIVTRVMADGFYALEGNRGPFPARVGEFYHKNKEPKLIGFVRLP